MTRRFITIKNSNRIVRFAWAILIFGLLWAGLAHAQFRSEKDREIVRDILKFFGSECNLRSANDGDLVKRIETDSTVAKRSKLSEVQKCFEDFYSQITGVYYLYQKICGDIGANSRKVSDVTMARQILEVNKYQAGISPYHSSLNDCLLSVPRRRGRPFIQPLAGNTLSIKVLQKELDDANVKEPFANTNEPFR